MEYKRINNKIVLRVDKGEEVLENITKVCKLENIKLASVFGIGATNFAKIGLFNVEEKKYYSTEFTEDYEITSLAGNISTMNNETYLHLHITIADDKQMCHGGHLNECIISATSEIIIDVIDGGIDREFNEEVGLNLIKF